jgi:hypothetical protein
MLKTEIEIIYLRSDVGTGYDIFPIYKMKSATSQFKIFYTYNQINKQIIENNSICFTNWFSNWNDKRSVPDLNEFVIK